MTQLELQAYLNKEFQGEDSFLETIIYPIFGEDNYETAYQLPILEDDQQLQAMAHRTGIRDIIKYGTVSMGHVSIDIFDVTVSDQVQMNRNRVTIQQIIRRIMDTYSSAFIIFHYQDNWQLDWRFSFCQKDDKEMTEAKRYTFLLGPNQSCRTVSQNFMKLFAKSGNISRDDIVEAFDVEALSKEFFKKYKQHYEKFVLYITGKVYEEVEKGKWKEVVKHPPHPQIYPAFGQNDKLVRDYIKRLLGRIVFLHFLQKKGWMGVEPQNDWGTGDIQFMKHLYELATDEQKDDFLDAILEPLFDKALDSEPTNDQWLFDTGVKALPHNGVLRFPYLNGGLFERDIYDEIPTRFPREYFADLLEFLYEYNFTIDENDPNDAEVGVDPEILGRIFENLLEDNKDKGAYYTKKEIVQYMTREALIAYLQTGIEDEEKKRRIRVFVDSHNTDSLHADEVPEVDNLLKNVKVCDPAIGSGAYPMGLLKEIFLCRSAIEGFTPEKASELKRHIIQNNIYGVDIEQGAVEIARLRFWLSLVVDEVSPQTLPNLDYKIVEGNSLYTTFEGEYIDLSTTISAARFRPSLINIRREKRELKSEQTAFFGMSGEEKYHCEISIKKHILDIIWYQLDFERNSWMKATVETESFLGATEKTERKKNKAQIIEFTEERQRILEKCETLKQILCDESIPAKERAKLKIPFFEWSTMFPDVFTDDNLGGVGRFDIVIGNPPYISAPNQLANPILAKQRETIANNKLYETINEKWDLYVPFMELGLRLLKKTGVFTMIVPYPLTNQKYGKKLRPYLCERHRLMEIVDAYGFNLFENATVYNCIPLIRKNGKTEQTIIAHYRDDKTINKDFVTPLERLIQDENSYVWNLTQEERRSNRFKNMYVLGDFCYISVGMVLNADEKVAKGQFKKADLIRNQKDEIHCKDYIEGKDIEKYRIKRIRYLEYGTNRCPGEIRRPTFPELYDRPKILTNKIGELMAICDLNHILCDQTNRICIRWSDLKGVKNKSISGSIKKYSTMERKDMEALSKRVDIFYLLGVLNSKHANELLDNIRGVGNIDVNPEYIRNIPIPLAPKETQEQIANIAKQILAAKQANPQADTSTEEAEIDKLVNQLYL